MNATRHIDGGNVPKYKSEGTKQRQLEEIDMSNKLSEWHKKSISTNGINDSNQMKFYADTSFGVHRTFRSHMGGCMTMGTGCIISRSAKQ